MTVEGHLIGAGDLRSLFDPDGPNSPLVEQVPCNLNDTLARRYSCCTVVRVDCRGVSTGYWTGDQAHFIFSLDKGVTGKYHIFSVTGKYHKIAPKSRGSLAAPVKQNPRIKEILDVSIFARTHTR